MIRPARRIAGAWAVLAAVVASAGVVSPATSPAVTGPTVARWLAMLADADPDARHEARFRLMGLAPADLPLLQNAVRTSAPSSPPVAAAVQEAVEYVLMRQALAREPAGEQPLLGVYWPPLPNAVFDRSGDPDESDTGVLLDVRFPCFVAFRYLDDGDRIVGELVTGQLRPITRRSELVDCIRDHKGGQTVTLLIQRGGSTQSVTLPLDRLPLAAAEAVADPQERQRRLDTMTRNAQAYARSVYERDFAPLLTVPGI